jgi:hypothetical protein
MTVCVLIAVPETLPPDRRHGGGLRTFARAGRQVLRSRHYVGYVVVSSSAMGALFAYVATSAFVLQSMNGMSPVGYSIDFAVNAGGMTVAALAAARLAGRIATRMVILVGQIAALAAGIAMLIGALWFDTPLAVVIISFFVLMTGQGLIGGNSGALASAEVPDHPRHRLRVAWVCAVGGRRHHRPPRRPRRGTYRRPDGPPHDRRDSRLHGRTPRPRPATTSQVADQLANPHPDQGATSNQAHPVADRLTEGGAVPQVDP